MDYKYIEQLLQRYWACETSLEEERILKTFFSQKEVPAALKRYKSLFDYEAEQSAVGLSNDFDERLLAAVGDASTASEEKPAEVREVKTRHMTLTLRLRPLYRAAAAVAIVTLLGTAIQESVTMPSPSGQPSLMQGFPGGANEAYQSAQPAPSDYEQGMNQLEAFPKGAATATADSSLQLVTPALSPSNANE